MKYALVYNKNEYSLKEACMDFMEMYVLEDNSDVLLEYIDAIGFIKNNKYLLLEEGIDNIVIVSDYDFEDFDFIKGM
jgi:hypothetical protein